MELLCDDEPGMVTTIRDESGREYTEGEIRRMAAGLPGPVSPSPANLAEGGR